MLHFRSKFAVKPHMHIVSWSPSHLENHYHLELSFDFQFLTFNFRFWIITSVCVSVPTVTGANFGHLYILKYHIRLDQLSIFNVDYHFCFDRSGNFQFSILVTMTNLVTLMS